MSELIANARCNLIVAELLLEADDAKIQDRYRIYVVGIDIGKNSFHIVGHDERGAIVFGHLQKSLNLPGDNSVYRTVCWMLRWPR
jgi:hypothetical protein